MKPSVGASLPCLPRGSLNLDVGSSSNIDSALKDFKLCIRRIQTVFASFQVELQLLDRLYYRGNNQHRTALFWRRIIEARRYGNRILAMDIHTKLDGVRMLFWNHDSKTLRRAWTHVPDVNVMMLHLAEIKSFCALVDRTRECMLKTYSYLNLNMQTGAFLQLILTMSAIISRMDSQLSELRPAAEEFSSALRRVAAVIGPTRVKPFQKLDGRSQQSLHRSDDIKHTTEIPSGDIGEVIPRESTAESDLKQVGANVDELPGLIFGTEATVPEFFSSNVMRKVVPRDALATPSTTALSKRKKERQQKKSEKKQRKRDEIDDIFGL